MGDGLGKVDGDSLCLLGQSASSPSQTHEEKQPGSGQILGSVRGSGLDSDSSRGVRSAPRLASGVGPGLLGDSLLSLHQSTSS